MARNVYYATRRVIIHLNIINNLTLCEGRKGSLQLGSSYQNVDTEICQLLRYSM